MVKSMTGYGRSEISSEYVYGYVEVKSKNHRYLDVNISLPRKLNSLEIPLQKILSKRVTRGKVDLTVQISAYLKPEYSLSINKELLGEYKKIVKELEKEFGANSKVDLVKAMQLNDLIVTSEDRGVVKEHLAVIEDAAIKAIDNLEVMRAFEGEKLINELVSFMNFIENMTDKISTKREETVSKYYDKIKNKIANLLTAGPLKDKAPDEQRLYQEVAYIIDKTDITEEIARLKSHLRQFDRIIKEDTPIGKKLDFLFQEVNREINTIASKANDFDISSITIEMKNELEKAREQAQNVE